MARPTAVAVIVGHVRRATRALALVGGVVLLACVGLVVAEILMRRLVGQTLHGVHELSGYALALVATWSFAFALTEQAHVRIDVIQARLASPLRALLDTVALGTTAAVALTMAWLAWPVLARSLAQGARANTPLETPLWIPQALWVAGWGWFALVAWVLFACAVVALVTGRPGVVEGFAGAQPPRGDGDPLAADRTAGDGRP